MPERDGHGMDCSAGPEHAPHPPSEITSPRKAERPIPGTLIPGTRRFATPSAASASVAAPPSRTCGASDSVLHQRSGRQASVSPRATADTRAAMTAELTAVCDQQTAEGAGRVLSGSAASGPRDGQIAVARQKAGGRLCAVRADLPGLCSAASWVRAAPNPRTLTGWFGASPHVLRFPPRAFLRFPVCPPGPSPSSAFFWFPFVRRSPVRSLRPLPGFRFPLGFPPGSLPLSNLHVSAAVRRFRRRWSRAAGTKVTSPAATTSPGSRDPPALQMSSGWARSDVATESPVTSGRERRTSPRPNRPDRRNRVRQEARPCSCRQA